MDKLYTFINCTGHDVTLNSEDGDEKIVAPASAHPAHVVYTTTAGSEEVNGIPSLVIRASVEDLPELPDGDFNIIRIVTREVAIAAKATGRDTRGMMVLQFHKGRSRLARVMV